MEIKIIARGFVRRVGFSKEFSKRRYCRFRTVAGKTAGCLENFPDLRQTLFSCRLFFKNRRRNIKVSRKLIDDLPRLGEFFCLSLGHFDLLAH
jgi:hypothetical protein